MITGTPCFTVKASLTSTFNGRELFACGTESGKIMVGDITRGFEEQQENLLESKTAEELEHLKALKQSYYINFP